MQARHAHKTNENCHLIFQNKLKNVKIKNSEKIAHISQKTSDMMENLK
jgi:hypothetical protein